MDYAFILLAGILLGGAAVYLLTRDQLRGMAALVGATETRDQLHDAQHARDAKTILELAHKVSAPEQGAIDHVFDKEKERRTQQAEIDRRQKIAAQVERALAERGISPSEVADPAALLDPDLMGHT